MFIFSFRFYPIFLSFSQLFSLSVFFSSFLLLSYRSLLLYNILKYFFFCLPMFCSVWCSCLSVISSFCDILLILLCYVLNFYLTPPHRTQEIPTPISFSPFFSLSSSVWLSICHSTSLHYTLPLSCHLYFSILFHAFIHARNQNLKHTIKLKMKKW